MTELAKFLRINLNNQYDDVLKDNLDDELHRECATLLVVDKLNNKVIRLPLSV